MYTITTTSYIDYYTNKPRVNKISSIKFHIHNFINIMKYLKYLHCVVVLHQKPHRHHLDDHSSVTFNSLIEQGKTLNLDQLPVSISTLLQLLILANILLIT